MKAELKDALKAEGEGEGVITRAGRDDRGPGTVVRQGHSEPINTDS